VDKTRHVPEQRVEMIGKLNRIVLNSLSFELIKEGSIDGAVRIQTQMEVGITDKVDAYYVAVNIDISAKSKENNELLFGCKGKMTGYYSLEKPFDGKQEDLASGAIRRAGLQIYPLLRLKMLETLRSGRVGVKEFALEPIFQEPMSKEESPGQVSSTPKKEAKVKATSATRPKRGSKK
jgi:preprotein translocase subunit SecB